MATSSGLSKDTIQVTGIPQVIAKLRAVGADLTDMSDLMHNLGLIVIAHAVVPRDTGNLASTLRSGHGKTKAVVRAGYANRAPYAGVVHYGDPHPDHRRTADPFLTDSLKKSRTQIVTALSNGIAQILKKNDLT